MFPRHANSDADGDINAYNYDDSYSYSDSDCNSNGNTHRYINACYSNANTRSKTCSYTKGSPHVSTAAVIRQSELGQCSSN